MSKKKNLTQAEVEALAESQNQSPEADQEAQVQTFVVKKADALAPIEGFDPKNNLRTVTTGVWRYICKDIHHVKDEVFESDLAKSYGIKVNDMIYLVANKKHRIVVV